MKSKSFALIALLFAVLFLVSSAIAGEISKDDSASYKAEEANLSENQDKPDQPAEQSNPVNDEKQGWGGHGGCGHGGCGGGGGGHGGCGGHGCGGGWGGGGHGGCRRRCGNRCCGSKEMESKEAKP